VSGVLAEETVLESLPQSITFMSGAVLRRYLRVGYFLSACVTPKLMHENRLTPGAYVFSAGKKHVVAADGPPIH
jgi:hypothetical protein